MPRVEGTTGAILRGCYRLLAAVTIAMIVGSAVFNALDLFRNIPSAVQFGFRTVTTEDNRAIVGYILTPSATNAGLRVNDSILAIAGEKLPSRPSEFQIGARLDAATGDHVALSVVNVGGPVRSVSLPRLPQKWQFAFLPYLPVWAFAVMQFVQIELPAMVLLGASLLLFVRRPHDPEALLIAFAFLPVCYFTDTAFWVTALLHVPASVFQLTTQLGLPLCFVAFAILPDGRFTNWLCYVPLILFAEHVAMSLILYFGLFRLQLPGTSQIPPLVGIVLSAVAAVIVRFVRTPAGTARQQIKWSLIGMFVSAFGFLFGLPFALIVDAGGGPSWTFIPAFFIEHVLSYIGLPLGLLVAVLGYRLYDAEVAITRSTALAGLMVSLVAVFVASENMLSGFGSQLVSHSFGSFAGGLAAAVTAMTIAPLHGRFKKWADRSFRSPLFNLRERLPLVVGDLRETTSAGDIAKVIVERVRTGIRADKIALLIDDTVVCAHGVEAEITDAWRASSPLPDSDELQCVRKDPAFPVRLPLVADGVGRVGWLLLGPRPDGSFYGKDERAALAEIADPIARAIAIASTRAARAALRMEEARSRDARIAEIELRIERLFPRAT